MPPYPQNMTLSPLAQEILTKRANNADTFTKNPPSLSLLQPQPKRVSFGEGVKLVAKGFFVKIKDMITDIVKHPIKTAAAIALTSGVLLALPLISIPTAVGASVIALGFAGFSLYGMGKAISSALRNSQAGDNDALREDLKNIGGKTLDLAISLPFVPKAFNTVKNQIKYGKIGVNTELWNNFKNAKGIKAKYGEIRKANVALINDVNFQAGVDKLQKQLKFDDKIKQEYLDLRKYDGKEFIERAYARMTTDLGYGKDAPRLEILETTSLKRGGGYSGGQHKITMRTVPKNNDFVMSKSETLSVMRHELQHFQQFVDVERAKNAGYGFEKMLNDKQIHILESVKIPAENHRKAMNLPAFREYINNYRESMKSAQKVAARQGEITSGTKRFKDLAKIYKNQIDYQSLDTTLLDSKVVNGKKEIAPVANVFKWLKQLFGYRGQFIEREANRAGGIFTRASSSTMLPLIVSNIQTQSLKEQM